MDLCSRSPAVGARPRRISICRLPRTRTPSDGKHSARISRELSDRRMTGTWLTALPAEQSFSKTAPPQRAQREHRGSFPLFLVLAYGGPQLSNDFLRSFDRCGVLIHVE